MELRVVEECEDFVVSTSLLTMTKTAIVVCLNLKPDIFVQRLWLHSPGQMSVCVNFFKVLSTQKEREVKGT